MAKKDRNAQNADQPTDATDQPTASAEGATDQPTDAPAPISMEDFITRADRADWISVNDAATLIGVDSQKMRNAANNRAEFKAEGATLSVAVPGYSIKPLTYLSRAAVALYQHNNETGNTRAGQIQANGKRWIIRVKDSDREAVVAALAAFGITLEVASTPKRKKGTDAAATAADVTGGVDGETVAANADQPGDASAEHTNGVDHAADQHIDQPTAEGAYVPGV